MKRLKELRKEAKLNQKELATNLNVAQNTLSNWENGNREPDFNALQRIAEFFDVSTDYLMERSDNPGHNKNTQSTDIEKELSKLKKQLESQEGLMFSGEPLDDQDREMILNALEMGMKFAKKENKKYTPKKHRK